MVPLRFHGGLGGFWWKLLSTLVIFMLFSMLIAPLGVLAHHDNEADHQQTALANSVTGTSTLDLPPTTTSSTTPDKAATSPVKMAQPPKELVLETIKSPANAASLRKASKGDKIKVHYTGTLFTDGSEFDSSRRPGRGPFPLTLGAKQVITGWEEGIVGMVVGETRKLTIPPHMAYGNQGFPDLIPPQSTLVFVVELLEVTPPGGRSDL